MSTPDPTQNAPLPQFTIPPPPSADVLNTNLNAAVPNLSQQIAQARKNPEAIRDTQAKNLQKIAENERAITSSQLAQQEYGATAEANIARQSRERAQQIEQTYQDVRKQYPYPELHPTKDNIPTLTGLFSLIGVIGTALGGQGRLSAMGALNSMTGMMKGWQQGRQDLWERDKQEFDANMKKIKAVLDDAKSDSDRALKLMSYDVQEAQAAAKQAAVKLNSQVATQILENQGLVKFNEYLNGVVKDYQHAQDIAQRESARKEAHADAVAAREQAKKEKAEAGPMPSATERGHIRDNRLLSQDLTILQNKLKDPELRKQIKQYRGQLFFSEKSEILDAALQAKIPEKLREFATLVKQVRNKTYLDYSGKAVTGSEALRNYGAVIQPADVPEVMESKINVGIDRAKRFDQGYREDFPGYTSHLPPVGQSPAPASAVDYLRNNNDAEHRALFKEKYGYIPQGF